MAVFTATVFFLAGKENSSGKDSHENGLGNRSDKIKRTSANRVVKRRLRRSIRGSLKLMLPARLSDCTETVYCRLSLQLERLELD